jgi:hypothetical protein
MKKKVAKQTADRNAATQLTELQKIAARIAGNADDAGGVEWFIETVECGARDMRDMAALARTVTIHAESNDCDLESIGVFQKAKGAQLVKRIVSLGYSLESSVEQLAAMLDAEARKYRRVGSNPNTPADASKRRRDRMNRLTVDDTGKMWLSDKPCGAVLDISKGMRWATFAEYLADWEDSAERAQEDRKTKAA